MRDCVAKCVVQIKDPFLSSSPAHPDSEKKSFDLQCQRKTSMFDFDKTAPSVKAMSIFWLWF